MKQFFGDVLGYLQHQPFVLLFLVVAAGYALGRVKIKGVGLGATAATLVLALLLSLWASARHGINYEVPEFASSLFFNLFMFSVGMKVGPQFLSGLRRDAGKFIFMGTFIPLFSVAIVMTMHALMSLKPGLAAGILAGANTATPGLGSAQAALQSGGHGTPEALANLSTAFAFGYCISMVLFTVFMKFLPAIFGRDAVADARTFEAEISTSGGVPLPGASDEFLHADHAAEVRTFVVERTEFEHRTAGELRKAYPRVSVEAVKRNGKMMNVTDDFEFQQGDIVALFGLTELLLQAAERVGHEVNEPALRDQHTMTIDIVLMGNQVHGQSILDVRRSVGYGFYVNAVFRAGDQIPHSQQTILQKGDVLRVTGAKKRVDTLEKLGAKIVRPSISTDIVTLAIGLTIGAALGAIVVPIGAIKFSMGSAVGLLLVGIALSILRTRNPSLGGPYPEPARQLLEDLGLNVFIAIVGLNSGAGVVHAVESGVLAPILIGCLIAGFVPPVVAWVIGQYWFKMNSALLMGAVAGGRCNSAGMRAAQEASQSNVPAISYPVTFAISNLILTLLCYLIALLG